MAVENFYFNGAITILACQTVTGIPVSEGENVEVSSPASIPQGSASPIPYQGEKEGCLDGESYHPDNGFCYRDDGGVETLFVEEIEEIWLNADFEKEEPIEETNLVKYAIVGDEISSPEYEKVSEGLVDEQQDMTLHQQIWNLYIAMFPAESRSFVSNYLVFTDGVGGTIAATEQTFDNSKLWMIEVDVADASDLGAYTLTLIHEFGHLLTLNSNQIDVYEPYFKDYKNIDLYIEAEDKCDTYFTGPSGSGCAKPTSYIYLFYDEFWSDIYDEWIELEGEGDEYYDALDQFYYDHEDQFVSAYAVTNVGEDIAESWLSFITEPKPKGNSVADKKVLFFYRFPELVKLRSEIIARTYSRLIRMK